jgi:hypothetical protein
MKLLQLFIDLHIDHRGELFYCLQMENPGELQII